MVMMEISYEVGVHDVLGGDPRALLWSVALLIYEVLETTPTTNSQQLPDCVGRTPFDNPGRRMGPGGRNQRAGSNRLNLTDVKKVGFTGRDLGRLSLTDTGLITFDTWNSPKKKRSQLMFPPQDLSAWSTATLLPGLILWRSSPPPVHKFLVALGSPEEILTGLIPHLSETINHGNGGQDTGLPLQHQKQRWLVTVL